MKRFLEHARLDAELMGRVRPAVAERGEQLKFQLVELAAGYGYHFDATELVEHMVK